MMHVGEGNGADAEVHSAARLCNPTHQYALQVHFLGPIFSGFSCYRHHSTPYEHFPSAIEMKLTFFFPSLHKTLPSWSISRSLKISPGFTPARVHLPMSSILSLMAGIGTASCAALDTAPLGSWLCPQYDCRRGRAWTEPQHNRVQYWAFNIPHATRCLPKYLVGVSAFHLM